jgi:Cohesin domain/PEP-CTERM motif
MKTLLYVTIIIAAIFFFVPSRASADSVLIVSNPATATPTDTFDVAVNISGAVDLYDYELDLSFDPTVLEANSVSKGSFLDDGGATFFIPGTIDNIGGTISFNADTLLGPPPGVTGDGILLVFSFTALNPGTSALTIENEILQDSLGDIISDTTTAGSVTVETAGGGNQTVPEPSTLLLLLVGVVGLLALAATKVKTALSASFRG